MEKPLFTLKPQMAVAIIPTIVFGLFFSAMSLIFTFNLIGLKWGLVVSSILFVIVVFFRFMNLKNREYIFYKQRAEFYEGFLNIVKRNVLYTRITDCVLTKSVWDRMFKTGTIRLVTAGHVDVGGQAGFFGSSMMMGGGISIQYIEKPDEVYEYISKLLKIN